MSNNAESPTGVPVQRMVGPSDHYNPIKCLREEVERFKATNRFSPMLVTNFYAQASVVLAYVAELEDELKRMMARAEYVCAHKYGELDPVGTRIIAVSDLRGEIEHAKRVIRWPNSGAITNSVCSLTPETARKDKFGP